MRFRAERLDDTVTGERLRGDVREPLQFLLAAPARPPHALAQPHERVDDDRGARDADDGQPCIPIEQQHGVSDEGQALAQQIAHRFGDRLLYLRDVVGNARHQLAGRALAEKVGRLVEGVAEQLIPEVADDPLTDVRHQERREVRAETLGEVGKQDGRGPERQVAVARKGLVDDGLDEICDCGGGSPVEQHGGEGRNKPSPVTPGVPEQAREYAHSVNRYFNSTHSATNPSRQVIFFPSSYPRPS